MKSKFLLTPKRIPTSMATVNLREWTNINSNSRADHILSMENISLPALT